MSDTTHATIPNRRMNDAQIEDVRRQLSSFELRLTTVDNVLRGGNGNIGMVATLVKLQESSEISKRSRAAMDEKLDSLRVELGKLRGALDAEANRKLGERQAIERLGLVVKIGATILGALSVGSGAALIAVLVRLSEMVQQIP